MKEESNFSWTDAGDDDNFNSVVSSEIQNFQTFPDIKTSANRVNVALPFHDEKIFVDFECKDVKSGPTSLSSAICKYEFRMQGCEV
ncbi:hypothetical protein TKK_0004558 [Trichogramma kaykai]